MRPTPNVPVSWGELIDKITILEIKIDRLKPGNSRQNVLNELERIRTLADEALSSDPWLGERKEALRNVNDALWDIED